MNSLNNECQGIKTQYSLVEHLKLHSECDEKYKNLYATWVQDEKVYTNALATITTSFPHYSMHDSSHSWSIINKIEMLLGEARIKQLSPTDTFLILETAFVHDLGMIISEEEQKKLWSEIEFQKYIEDTINNNYDKDLVAAANYIKDVEKNGVKESKDWPLEVKKDVIILNADYFRRIHNHRSAEVIMHSSQIDVLRNRNNLIQERIIRLIAQISIMHGTNFDDILEKLYQKENGVSTDEIHPRMITCLLRLGDLLDLDNGRFNEVLTNTIYMPESSQEHKEKHQAITHFLVSPERIEVAAICPNDSVYRATRQWFDWLQDELKNLSSKWSDIVPHDFIGGPPSLGDIKLSIRDNNRITKQLNFKFSIDQKVAFEFIEGAGIYKNKLDCIREIIQNALDATKIQIWNDIKSEKYDLLDGCADISKKKLNFSSDIPLIIKQLYPLKIKLEYLEKEKLFKLEIEDSGCGISLYDLKRMESVGNSWSKDIKMYEKFELMEDWIKPTGSFGIGLHSLFMITDKVEIQTKAENGDAYDIIFISSKNNGYISTKVNNERRKNGTKVAFQFKCDVCEDINLHDYDGYSFNENVRKFDVVDPDFEYKSNVNIVCSVINSYISSINWINIKRDGLLNEFISSEIDSYYLDDKNDSFVKINDLEIKVDVDDKMKTIYAIVKDLSNYTEINFSLLSEEINDEKENTNIFFYAIGLGPYYPWRTAGIYYKNIFCMDNWGSNEFNIKVNFVMGNAKSLLSINRNNFRDTKIIDEYMERINTYIVDKVIIQMWQYILRKYNSLTVNNNYIQNANIVLLGLYYKAHCDHSLNLDILNNNPVYTACTYNKIKRIEEAEFKDASLKEIICEDKILLTENYYYEVEEIAARNDIKIVIHNISDINEITSDWKTLLLTFNKMEYISEYVYIAHKCKEEVNSKLITLDYDKFESVNNFLRCLYLDYEKYSAYRIDIDPFEYKNKAESNIKYLITTNYKILSPFTRDLDEQIFEKNIEECLKELKEKYKFNELIEYIYKNSLYKDSLEEKDCKKNIENAYKELILDYINFVYKENKETTKQSSLSRISDTTDEKEVAVTFNDMKEKETDNIMLE